MKIKLSLNKSQKTLMSPTYRDTNVKVSYAIGPYGECLLVNVLSGTEEKTASHTRFRA